MKLLTGTNMRLLDLCLLLLRCTVGIILFVAGAGKVFGWFGGYGLAATLNAFASNLGFSSFWTYMSSYTELIGGLLLILGLLTRPVAFLVTINMLVATIVLGLKGFFMPGGGAYPFSLMISSLIILLAGPMSFCLGS